MNAWDPPGAEVQSLAPGGPPERAGVRQGDVITAIDATSLSSKPRMLASPTTDRFAISRPVPPPSTTTSVSASRTARDASAV